MRLNKYPLSINMPKPLQNVHCTTLRLAPDLAEELEDAAHSLSLSQSDFVRWCIRRVIAVVCEAEARKVLRIGGLV